MGCRSEVAACTSVPVTSGSDVHSREGAPGGIAVAFRARLISLLAPLQVTPTKWESTLPTSATSFPRHPN